MLSKSAIKKISYEYSIFNKLLEHKGIKFISKGNSFDYEIIKNLGHQLKNDKLFLYSSPPIDIALEMIKRNTNIITYITNQHYETVVAETITNYKQKDNNQNDTIQQKLSKFLKSNRFVIRKTFIDLHPLTAYAKICSFLGINRETSMTKIFKRCSFSSNEIPNNTYILPHLKQLRMTYLQTKQLKLKKLDRIRYATHQQIGESLKLWENTYRINDVYTSSSDQQTFKKDFVLNQKMGEFVSVSQMLEGYGERYYYASWQQN